MSDAHAIVCSRCNVRATLSNSERPEQSATVTCPKCWQVDSLDNAMDAAALYYCALWQRERLGAAWPISKPGFVAGDKVEAIGEPVDRVWP